MCKDCYFLKIDDNGEYYCEGDFESSIACENCLVNTQYEKNMPKKVKIKGVSWHLYSNGDCINEINAFYNVFTGNCNIEFEQWLKDKLKNFYRC